MFQELQNMIKRQSYVQWEGSSYRNKSSYLRKSFSDSSHGTSFNLRFHLFLSVDRFSREFKCLREPGGCVCSNFTSSFSSLSKRWVGIFRIDRKFLLRMFGFAGKYNPILTVRSGSAPPGVLLTLSSFSVSLPVARVRLTLSNLLHHLLRLMNIGLNCLQLDRRSIRRIVDGEMLFQKIMSGRLRIWEA